MSPLALAIAFCAVLLFAGFLARRHVGLFRALYLPASVIAGLGGLAVLFASGTLGAPLPADVVAELRAWPGPLIAVVFASLLLRPPDHASSFRDALGRGARSAMFAWLIILGQLFIGLSVYLLVVPNTITPSFAQLLEVSWAGGHGSSAAMGKVYDALGFPEGRDLAFFLATCGLLYGVLGGLLLVNLALRRGWTAPPTYPAIATSPATAAELAASTATPALVTPSRELPDAPDAAIPAPTQDAPLGTARSAPAVLDPLTLQVVLLAIAFALGLAFQQGFLASARLILPASDDPASPLRNLQNIPLFLFTLLGGLALRKLLELFRLASLLDASSLDRLAGVAMDVLIVAALSTLRLDALSAHVLPLTLLLAGGAAWSVFCLLVLAPRMLPRSHWFELGLLNFGFSTANTPQGLMLLRVVDPGFKTDAAKDYALAAPLSAPFIGGGLLTYAAFPALLAHSPPLLVLLGLAAAIALLYLASRQLRRA